ncbi:pyruvate ferredoxin oxidoreductase, partial [Patescibacteria group bacterium]|nr:pyruvate ferredoxin oxidoreductase [Patescibacteria group bacterium]
WLHIFSETAQEAYENTLLALRLSEKVLLPSMVMLDGFFTTHNVEGVNILPDEVVKKFVGEYKADKPLLDTDNPITVGPVELQNYFMETKWQQNLAMKEAKKEYLKIGQEFSKITGNKYELFEEYRTKDAEYIMVVLSSTAGTTKDVVDELRDKGQKVGLLRPRLFRPFPYQEMLKALEHAKRIAVLDRSESYGSYPPLYSEIRNAFYDSKARPELWSYVFGLGGRDISKKELAQVFSALQAGKKPTDEITYIGLRK